MPRKVAKKKYSSSKRSKKSKSLRKQRQIRRQRQRRTQKRSKRAGMLSSLKKFTSRKSYEDKIYEDIDKLLKINMPKSKRDKDALSAFILKDTSKQNKKNIYFPLKIKLYSIAEKISHLDVINPHKERLLRTLEIVLKRFVGQSNIIFVMSKLRAPSDISSRNNIELSQAFANLDLKNSKRKMKSAIKSVNSRLKNSNRAAKAFIGNNSNNDWVKVNGSEVNALLNETRNSMIANLPSVPTTVPKAKGGYRNSYSKKVYS